MGKDRFFLIDIGRGDCNRELNLLFVTQRWLDIQNDFFSEKFENRKGLARIIHDSLSRNVEKPVVCKEDVEPATSLTLQTAKLFKLQQKVRE